jgi:hypothetical protein
MAQCESGALSRHLGKALGDAPLRGRIFAGSPVTNRCDRSTVATRHVDLEFRGQRNKTDYSDPISANRNSKNDKSNERC